MAATVFPAPVNDLATTLAAGRGIGSASLILAAGSGAKILAALAELGYGGPTASKPLRLTVTKATYTGRGDVSVIQATGLATDTLTGCTVVEGTPDQAFAIGDTVEIDPTAGTTDLIEKAVNAIETATTQATPAANRFYADSGGGTPAFRAIAAGDVPNLAESQVTNLVADLATKATDTTVVHLAGIETITGTKTFSTVPTLPNQAANLVLAGPTSGAAAAPTFRALVTADLPAGGGGAPGGSTGQLQYNNAGAFGGTVAGIYATSGSLFTFQAQATTDIPLVVKGAVSQGNDLQQWQDSTGAIKSRVDQFGFFYSPAITATGGNGFLLGAGQGTWANASFQFPSSCVMSWANTNASSGTKDVGVERQTTNMLKVHDGTSGQAVNSNLGLLKGRIVLRTGAGAPTGTPTDGELYWDTTNFKLSAGAGGVWKTLATAFT